MCIFQLFDVHCVKVLPSRYYFVLVKKGWGSSKDIINTYTFLPIVLLLLLTRAQTNPGYHTLQRLQDQIRACMFIFFKHGPPGDNR
jgi:hypothetical protein